MSITDQDIELRLLLEAIHLKYQYDFRQYATASLRRRLSQALNTFGCRTLLALQERVLRDPAVFHQLLTFLTVQVSEMFRDPEFYGALRDKVMPFLHTYPSRKVWVAGCSTGEEVYSLAIVLHEEGLLERSLIYATDINPEALHKAEAGIYELDRIAQFSDNYRLSGGRGSLSDYYTAAYGAAAFDRALMRNVVFSDHSLSTDSVFAELQLVCCRNVLIYFNRDLQDRALGLFRESLCHKGFLALGSKETINFSSHARAFTAFVREHRIYQKL